MNCFVNFLGILSIQVHNMTILQLLYYILSPYEIIIKFETRIRLLKYE